MACGARWGKRCGGGLGSIKLGRRFCEKRRQRFNGRTQARQANGPPPERLDAVRSMLASGASMSQVARVTGISRATLYRHAEAFMQAQRDQRAE